MKKLKWGKHAPYRTLFTFCIHPRVCVPTYTFIASALVWSAWTHVLSLSAWNQSTQHSSFQVIDLSWGRWGETGNDWLYNQSSLCPGTGLLNQPQVSDMRIWIESQWGAFPEAACRHSPLLEADGCAVVGISGTESERLMRKEKALSSSPSPPFILNESPRGAAILRTQALVWKSYLFQLQSNPIRHNGWESLFLPAWQVRCKRGFCWHATGSPKSPHASKKTLLTQ